VVDVPPPHDGDSLESAVWMLGEPRDDISVVHAPAAEIGEVSADLAPVERLGRSQGVVSFGIVIHVMNGEDEWVQPVPGKTQFHDLQHWF
jgi:hypothetical protein